VRAYLDVEGLRLGDCLRIREEIAADVMDALVPPFLLQPLVENAIRHGLQSRREGGIIQIWAESSGYRLKMAVSDSGDGMPPETRSRLFDSDGIHSHALGLMPRRLRGLYGGAFSLSIDSAPGEGTTVSLSLPLQFAGDALECECTLGSSQSLSPRDDERTRPVPKRPLNEDAPQ
jgi:sensor histidine kinase YesM